MTQIYKVSECNDELLIKDIFHYLLDIEQKSPNHTKFFFGGTPSNDPGYAGLSNNLTICVVAKEERVALCLHTFLRTIVNDQDRDRFMSNLIDSDKEQFTMEEIVDLLAR